MKAHLILGSEGIAIESYWVVKECFSERSIFFVNPVAKEDSVNVAGTVIPVFRDWNFSRSNLKTDYCFTVGIEDPATKKDLVEQALFAGIQPAAPVVSPSALHRPDAKLGVGTVGHARCYISTNVTVGDFVTLMPMAGLAHDVTVGNYVTCAPLSTTCGYSILEEGVYVGQGSSIRERTVIAPWVTINMQSSVVANILEPGSTVGGVPARPA